MLSIPYKLLCFSSGYALRSEHATVTHTNKDKISVSLQIVMAQLQKEMGCFRGGAYYIVWTI